jgi:hypothetical protein
MARPIKETPTLYGEDARRFAQAMEHPRTVSVEDVRRAEDAYNQIMSISNFTFLNSAAL